MNTNFFILIFSTLTLFSACTSTNVEKESENTFVVKDKTEENTTNEELLTKPNLPKKDLKEIKYEDLEVEMQGGIVNVKIEDEDFAEKDYIFETLRSENVVDYDANLKTVNIMVANYQNTNTNLVITAIGDNKGVFPIVSSSQRSATVTLYYNNGLANIEGSLETGTLTIEVFDEEKGYTKGNIVGKTKKGSPIQATFSVYSNK